MIITKHVLYGLWKIMMFQCGFNITNYQRNVNQNSKEVSHWSEWPSSKYLQTINAGEGEEKREPSYTVGENVYWYSHYGEQYGGSLKN